jgi:glycosyltransferase involved in cell wall biosynthesis
LKVIQIIDSLNAGGAEVLAVNIANELAEQGVESHICSTRKEGVLKSNITDKVNYLFLNRKKRLDFNAILKLRNYAIKHKIDIIHAHSSSFFIAFCIKMLHPKIKIVWHDHFGKSEFLNQRKKSVLKITSFSFSTIISVNLDLKKWAINNLRSKEVHFLRNFAVFNNLNEQTILKNEIGKRIVHLAGYRPQKDHLNLLKAFKEILKKHKDWSLHLIGENYNDFYGKSIKEYIEKEQLSKSVFEYGVCSDIKNILSQATIGVLSSNSEGLPIALLEYGLAKLPVLVTKVGECENVIKNEDALVIANNSLKFATKLSMIISNNSIKNQIKEELHTTVLNKHSKESVIKNLQNIYKNLC